MINGDLTLEKCKQLYDSGCGISDFIAGYLWLLKEVERLQADAVEPKQLVMFSD